MKNKMKKIIKLFDGVFESLFIASLIFLIMLWITSFIYPLTIMEEYYYYYTIFEKIFFTTSKIIIIILFIAGLVATLYFVKESIEIFLLNKDYIQQSEKNGKNSI